MITGENGESTTISTGTAENTVSLSVPNQVEAIVAWITSNFNSELTSILSQYNITFTAGGAVQVNSTETNSTQNETEGNNSTDNGTIIDNNGTDNGTIIDNNGTETNGTGTGSGSGSIDLFVNYTLPDGCSFTDDNNDTVRCSSGNARGVTFTLAQVKEYFNSTALEVCTDYTDVLSSCSTNSVINDLATCLRLSLFNKFQMAQETVIYGWLSYDVVARNTLFGRCQAENDSFNGTSEQFSSGFTFDFPNIN